MRRRVQRDAAHYEVDLSPPPDSTAVLPRNVLYQNNGDGTFTDTGQESKTGDTGYGMGCAVADYDNDGDQDLYVTNYGPNVLYQNNGDGTFANATEQAAVGASQWSTSVSFLDYDNDGELDFYVTNYVDFTVETNKVCGGYVRTNSQGHRAIVEATRSYCAPLEYGGVPDVLYHNNGDGTFADVSVAAGINDPSGKGLGVIALDYDSDGDQDLFVANDGTPNFLYQNLGNGKFGNAALAKGVALNGIGESEAGMGVDFGDYDNDGDFDLFVTNFSYETNTLYRNEGSFLQGRDGGGWAGRSEPPLPRLWDELPRLRQRRRPRSVRSQRARTGQDCPVPIGGRVHAGTPTLPQRQRWELYRGIFDLGRVVFAQADQPWCRLRRLRRGRGCGYLSQQLRRRSQTGPQRRRQSGELADGADRRHPEQPGRDRS